MKVDIAVVGAGILGVCIAYWISRLYDCDIVLLDKEASPGVHASSRNTGVLHRPFYLNPRKKRIFARAAAVSYPMWKTLSAGAGLPWLPVGTLSVAVSDAQVSTLHTYHQWGLENGMEADQLVLLDPSKTRELEPEVHCRAALLSRTDVSVDFGSYTRHLGLMAQSEGARFQGGIHVDGATAVEDRVAVRFVKNSQNKGVLCKLLINAAGAAPWRSPILWGSPGTTRRSTSGETTGSSRSRSLHALGGTSTPRLEYQSFRSLTLTSS